MHAVPILSIRQLVQELLRHRDTGAYTDILSRYAVPTRDLEAYFRWNSRHYTRTCISRNEDFELLLICYEPGQRTSIHDYDSQMAWIHPVMGEVYEELFTFHPVHGLELESGTLLKLGNDDALLHGSAVHRFENRGPERAVTLNLYARPVSKWRVYHEGTGHSTVSPAGPLL